MFKKVITSITAVVTLAFVASCAGNTISGIKNDNNSGFSIAGDATGKGGFGRGHFMGGFLKDLNLTDDQKAQFEAMKKEMKTDMSKNKGDKDAFKNTLKEAFLSTTINKADLQAKLQALKPQDDNKTNLMAANIIKAYNILNAEQRTKIETKITEMENKFQDKGKNPVSKMFQGFKEKRMEWFTSDLNLNDSQKETLKALFNQSAPDKTQMFENMKKIKNEVLAQLKSGSPNQATIAASLKQAKTGFEAGMDSRLDSFIKAHDTLSADQRQKLVTKLETMMSKMNHKGRGHKKFNKE